MKKVKRKNEITADYLQAFYKAARPALKYKWCYAVLTIVSVILVAADLAFAENSRKLFDLAPNIPHNIAIKIID